MNASQFEARLRDLLARLQGQFGSPNDRVPCDPVEEILLGILGRDTSESRAREVLRRLRRAMVDANELRVAAPADIVNEVGPDFPDAEGKARDMVAALSAIFAQTEGLDLEEFKGKPKREAGKWLSELPGIDPYTYGRVMLRCFGAHAVPVSAPILACLQAEGLFRQSVRPGDAQGVLERHVRSTDALQVFHLMHCWAEHAPARPDAAKGSTRRKDPSRRRGDQRTGVPKGSKTPATRARKAPRATGAPGKGK